jgi:hypothetical protein
MEFRLASGAFIVVLAAYVFLGGMGVTDRNNPNPRDAGYNLLARGLLSGHLYLDREVPAALSGLRDPFDPVANTVVRTDPGYRLHDLSFHGGRLYLYFGIAPALLVFIPWHLLTGGWLPHWVAVIVLCTAGLLVNLLLVRAIRRRVFPGLPAWTAAVATLILGLGSYAPLLAARADMWEIPIAFSYLSVSVALRCLWEAFDRPGHPAGWIALASAAFGTAFAARPTVLPNAAILLVPFAYAEIRRNSRAWMAAVLPLALCGAAVGLYNMQRFGSPFDFGMKYQLAGVYVARLRAFSADYVPTNLWFYLLQPVLWSRVFPYAHEPLDPAVPAGHGGTEHISGALLNSPILWAALAVAVFIRLRRPDRSLCLIAVSAAWVALSSLVLMSFFFGACSRYQIEFVPELALLASVGVMAIESSAGGRLRAILRLAWVPALLFSSAFPVLYGIDRCASDHNFLGISRIVERDVPGAIREFDTANFLSPGNPFSRLGSAVILIGERKSAEAEAVLQSLVHDFPGYSMGHFALANLLLGEGRRDEAIVHYRAAHGADPNSAPIKRALDAALAPAK